MVVCPQMIEQSIVARQVVALGAGLQLTSVASVSGLTSNTRVSAAAIREAVDCVMCDPRFAQNARRLGREFPDNTPALFADCVIRVASRERAATP